MFHFKFRQLENSEKVSKFKPENPQIKLKILGKVQKNSALDRNFVMWWPKNQVIQMNGLN